MADSWADRYIGCPHEPTLEANCHGFARRVYREVFGRDLMGMLGVFRALAKGEELPFKQVARPVDGCLVLMGPAANRSNHVGVYCGASRTIVHASDARGQVVSSPPRLLRAAYPSLIYLEALA